MDPALRVYCIPMKLERFTKLVPYAAALGMELEEAVVGSGRARLRQPWRAELLGDPDREILHGGVITALLDTLGGLCVFAKGGGLAPQATLDLRIDYFRPAAPRLDLIAEGECFRVTRHIAFVRGECHQGRADAPIAQMTATFMIPDRKGLAASLEEP